MEVGLEEISPGNLIVKEDLVSFIHNIHGIIEDRTVKIPLYPAIKDELC